MSEPQKYPAGWDEQRLRELAAYYDAQTEDEKADEIEAAWKDDGITMVAVPTELADAVRALIARGQPA